MKWCKKLPVGRKSVRTTEEIFILENDAKRALFRLTGRDMDVRAEADAIYISERDNEAFP